MWRSEQNRTTETRQQELLPPGSPGADTHHVEGEHAEGVVAAGALERRLAVGEADGGRGACGREAGIQASDGVTWLARPPRGAAVLWRLHTGRDSQRARASASGAPLCVSGERTGEHPAEDGAARVGDHVACGAHLRQSSEGAGDSFDNGR